MDPVVLTWFWVALGAIFCIAELVLPTGFSELTMGISAFIVAAISVVLPQFPIQVVLWLVLSVAIIVWLRRIQPSRSRSRLRDADEAETLTEILPGAKGRVLYEGTSWQARCQDEGVAIASQQRVYVVGREGTTLIILPMQTLKS
ncbi:NfeD family protein [Synechococcales cyanobacterium C]|uniref:NfeD family protein n=1 Tax=Petrachloros mirabilis ULC683 TaxID=2781853 RepID=A0A8K2A7H6_9CYAN|nr:NfeD family protein [Petrachloros mirabilis]NCJ06934.1 NfeD family protein [Petrachloros mirabilis ULC683]